MNTLTSCCLVHRLLAHEGTLTPAMLTTRFIDGLRDDIRAVVIVQHPTELDTVCSFAFLQEDVTLSVTRQDRSLHPQYILYVLNNSATSWNQSSRQVRCP